jgi:hypothetical protein
MLSLISVRLSNAGVRPQFGEIPRQLFRFIGSLRVIDGPGSQKQSFPSSLSYPPALFGRFVCESLDFLCDRSAWSTRFSH